VSQSALVEPSASEASPTDLQEAPRSWIPTLLSWRNPIGIVGAAIVALTVLTAAFGPLLWRVQYSAQHYRRLQPPSLATPMGTDELGRDLLARVIHGAQVSLQVGAVAVLIALTIGLTLGLVAGYYGGTLDAFMMRIVDIGFAFPGLVLAIVITGLLGPSRTNAMIAIGIVYAPAFARVVRASVLEILSRPFIEASRALGSSTPAIMVRHLLPNIVAPVIVMITVYLSTAILSEAALSFHGLGTQPPEPSWGGMLNASRTYMELAPWMTVFPGLAIMVVIMGFNFLGDGLRDVLDPRLKDV